MDTTEPTEPTGPTAPTASPAPERTTLLRNLGISAVVVLVVTLTNGGGWPFWLMGALYALVLALGVWCASAPVLKDWSLRPADHAVAAAIALVVGGAAWWLSGGDNNAFWAVGVIAGIASSISAAAWRHSR